MDKTDCIENLLEKPNWLIDVLPKQVPAGFAGQYFKAERYFLSWLDEISWKFARVLIRLNCYYDIQVSTDGETWILNESPEDMARRFEESATAHSPLSILIGSDGLAASSGGRLNPVYALADCNNFFASCERFFRPELNGKPVIVLSINDGCAEARSNEAKAFGRGAVLLGSQGSGEIKMSREHQSPHYTTLWSDIPKTTVR